MKSLYQYILEGKGHSQLRLGGGSSGVAYDLGNGWVRKTMRVLTNVQGTRKAEFDMIDKWAKVRKGLSVIPYIKNWNGDSYDLEKYGPCEEAEWIDKVVWRANITPQAVDDGPDPIRVKKAESLIGKEKTEWVLQWLKDFNHDAKLILGTDRYSDDIRAKNIGKNKNGEVKCFDWLDPYC